MKSWYELRKDDAYKLEQEFLKNEIAREENLAMHLQIILGMFFVITCFSIIFYMIVCHVNSLDVFILLLFGLIMGIVIVVMSTIEYHIKFNSWLLVKHKIVKK